MHLFTCVYFDFHFLYICTFKKFSFWIDHLEPHPFCVVTHTAHLHFKNVFLSINVLPRSIKEENKTSNIKLNVFKFWQRINYFKNEHGICHINLISFVWSLSGCRKWIKTRLTGTEKFKHLLKYNKTASSLWCIYKGKIWT